MEDWLCQISPLVKYRRNTQNKQVLKGKNTEHMFNLLLTVFIISNFNSIT